MKIVDIANEILTLDSVNPNSTSIPAIAFFLRSNIGYLNNILCEDFKIDTNTLEIVHHCGKEIHRDAVTIIKQIYKIYDAKLQIANNMNALATNQVLAFKDNFGGGEVTIINRNEMAKTWASIMKQETEVLNNIVGLYKIGKSLPIQVAGDDTVGAHYGEHLVSMRDV